MINTLAKYQDYKVTVIHHVSTGGNISYSDENTKFAVDNLNVFNWDACNEGDILHTDKNSYIFLSNKDKKVLLFKRS